MRTWDEVGKDAQDKFDELSHKGWDWRSFYNGYLEGASSERQSQDVLSPIDSPKEKEHNGQPIGGDVPGLSVEDQVRLYRASGGSVDGERKLRATLEADQAKLSIRADLVEKLKGYAVHGPECNADWLDATKRAPCTCGLTEVLKEMECGYLAYCPNGRPEVCPRCRKPASTKPIDE